jgi:hypothetical protein
MDEQMVTKQSERYTQAVNTGTRLAKRWQRLTGLLQYAKVGLVRYRLRPS